MVVFVLVPKNVGTHGDLLECKSGLYRTKESTVIYDILNYFIKSRYSVSKNTYVLFP